MTLGPPAQVGQAAAAGALTKTNPLSITVRCQTIIVGLHEDADLRGPSMLGDVGQRFPQLRPRHRR